MTTKTEPAPMLHGVEETARRLSMSPTTIRDLVRRRELDGRKAGVRLLITEESITEYVARLPRVGKEG